MRRRAMGMAGTRGHRRPRDSKRTLTSIPLGQPNCVTYKSMDHWLTNKCSDDYLTNYLYPHDPSFSCGLRQRITGVTSRFHSQPGKSALYRHLCLYAPSGNLIRYNSCDAEVRDACAMEGEKNGKDNTQSKE